MASLVLMALLLAMAGHSSATWCVCKDGLSDQVLQKALDYACGAGADCNPIHQSGPCFQPNTVRAHCSYAANSYFQKNRQQATACDFNGAATISASDPSISGCAYPATASASSTPTTTTPGTTTPVSGTTGTSTGNSPVMTNPNTGVLGGPNNGLGPSGMNTDMSDAGIRLPNAVFLCFSVVLAFSALVFW
ncbi:PLASMODESMATA CALLOSE-BINDING PROTEIN 3-like [Salvia miltiorrhiza]|uniref:PLASMODESMATA CALLOSE-BINDING PROTEIN 3-like n=1 Tax=Salvia miltiorrhiza TaxID=226208 RepID=UPI0025ACEF56|nr:PLASMODESMATA CALLOSE-BINDING PROTEIN 3-like [Salvia miltiorrhiza]